jgi:hypothetical protein
MPSGYLARPEQNVLVTVSAWDANCPQHIPQLFTAADVADLVKRIESLKAELACSACGAGRALIMQWLAKEMPLPAE